MFPKGSFATTERVPATPAVLGEGKPETARVLAAAGFTVIGVWVPVMLAVTVSVAVMLRAPAVFSVAEKVCAPLSAAVNA